MSAVHLVVPDGIDDPARVSGGNRYDRRACDALRAAGWELGEIAVPGAWPTPDVDALAGLARSLDALPDGSAVLVDGLVASGAAGVLVPRAARLRLVVLVHMLFGGDAVAEEDERAVLGAARAVVATSGWTRRRLLERYRLPAGAVHVARPGTDPAAPGAPSADGGRLLCVGSVSPVKGQDLLVSALAEVPGVWCCRLVGPAGRAPAFAAELRHRVADAGLGDRVVLAGPRTVPELAAEYGAADLLVVPSRTETYGMVVGEALAAGVPVLAADVGGVAEALGCTAAGRPGVLVPPGDPAALAAALRSWLADPGLRAHLRRAALLRRHALPGWPATADGIAAALRAVGCEPERRQHRGPW